MTLQKPIASKKVSKVTAKPLAEAVEPQEVNIADASAGLSQSEKFIKAARELGADGDEEAFKGVLQKLAKPKVEN